MPTKRGSRAQDVSQFDIAKWKCERLTLLRNKISPYGATAIEWQEKLIDAFTGDSKDAKYVRKWLARHVPSGEYRFWADYPDRLSLVFLTVSGAMADAQSAWEALSAVDQRAHLEAVAKAAKGLKNLMKMSYAPSVPPLWYFLNDAHAESLLKVIDRGRTLQENNESDLHISAWKATKDSMDQHLGVETQLSRADPRNYQIARLLYSENVMPARWDAAADTPFLSANTADLISRLADFHSKVSLTEDRTMDGGMRDARYVTKQIYGVFRVAFQTKFNPNEFIAACVNLLIPPDKQGGVSVANVRKWTGQNKKKK